METWLKALLGTRRTRVLGISTAVMNRDNPRVSVSEALLDIALHHAAGLGCETRTIRLREIRLGDEQDDLADVYEALVRWADVVLMSTPIRWGMASPLYSKLAERMRRHHRRTADVAGRAKTASKVAAFIITGAQQNVAGVASNVLAFCSELGFSFPPSPFIAHTRAAENTERDIAEVQHDAALREAARALAQRALERQQRMAQAQAQQPPQARRGSRLNLVLS